MYITLIILICPCGIFQPALFRSQAPLQNTERLAVSWQAVDILVPSHLSEDRPRHMETLWLKRFWSLNTLRFFDTFWMLQDSAEAMQVLTDTGKSSRSWRIHCIIHYSTRQSALAGSLPSGIGHIRKSSGIMNGLGTSYVHSHGWSEQQSNPRLVQKMCQKRTAGGGSCSREIDCNLLSARIETRCFVVSSGGLFDCWRCCRTGLWQNTWEVYFLQGLISDLTCMPAQAVRAFCLRETNFEHKTS